MAVVIAAVDLQARIFVVVCWLNEALNLLNFFHSAVPLCCERYLMAVALGTILSLDVELQLASIVFKMRIAVTRWDFDVVDSTCDILEI